MTTGVQLIGSNGLPVIPVPALSVGILGEVGSEVEAGLGRLTPRTLTGVRQTLPTRPPPVTEGGKVEIERVAYCRSNCLKQLYYDEPDSGYSLVADFRAPPWVANGSIQFPPSAALVVTLLAGVDLPLTVVVLSAKDHKSQRSIRSIRGV